MEPSDVIVYVTSKVGTVPGRTVLQKLCYFVNAETGSAIPFRPHYYGPYSSDVAEATDTLLSSGFLDESKESGSLSSPWVTPGGTVITDWERRTYKLTKDGETYLGRLPADERKILARSEPLLDALRDSTGLDPTKLSNVAKIHFIISTRQAERSNRESLVTAVNRNGWRLSATDVEEALKTLDKLTL
ncbi:MAG: hypothetical protein M1126_06365 [Candidatus Thermoplasmatota archaeon]|nr:hypothetical protein [Candidatus Thermoplasmatota archaeon]